MATGYPMKADHRNVAQWQFFVIPEKELPVGQKSISLNPLRRLVDPIDYTVLGAQVTNALPDEDSLKITELPEDCSSLPGGC